MAVTAPTRIHPITRLLRWFFRLPDPILRGLSGRPAIEVDGRRLHAGLQLMVAANDRLGRADQPMVPSKMRKEMLDFSNIGAVYRQGVEVVDRTIGGHRGNPIPLRTYRRIGTDGIPPAIVYFHGGGWVLGDLDTHDGPCRLIADVTGCQLVSVDYRLAPEHPFPAGVDDCLDAYRWVHDHAVALSIDPTRIGVMGDSAGGNLSAVVAQQLRSVDVAPPAAQCLIYPAVDMRMESESMRLFSSGFLLEKKVMHWFREQYVGDPDELLDPRVSPILAESLAGLPPALIYTAGFDPLRDEGLAYHEALTAAGVSSHYRCYNNLAHGFFNMMILPEGIAICEEIARSMGHLLGAPEVQ